MKTSKKIKIGGKETGGISEINKANLSPQGLRILEEWRKIDELCRENKRITYMLRKRNNEGLPVEFEVIYKVRSIVGVKEAVEEEVVINGITKKMLLRRPVYADEHRLQIVLPNNYPAAHGGNPDFTMLSAVWHPNIKYTGNNKGHICLNNKDLTVKVPLAQRILRVGYYLQYRTYWAINNYPYPEDETVATWVREEAEPLGWVNMEEGIFTDYTNLTEKLHRIPDETNEDELNQRDNEDNKDHKKGIAHPEEKEKDSESDQAKDGKHKISITIKSTSNRKDRNDNSKDSNMPGRPKKFTIK